MRKLIALVVCCLLFSFGYASVPKTNNHGFVLDNQSKTEKKIVTEKKKNTVENTNIIKSKPNKTIATKNKKKVDPQKLNKKEVTALVKEGGKEISKNCQINNSTEKILLPEKSLGKGGLVILAVFFPLLAVLLGFGLKKEFWICLLLHLLALIPAWIYAIVVLSR